MKIITLSVIVVLLTYISLSSEARSSDISNVFDSNMISLSGSGTGSGCPPNYTGPAQLVGIQEVDSHFETPGILSSDQVITGAISVEYDSGTCIELLPGFEVKTGAIFNAYIDGCTP